MAFLSLKALSFLALVSTTATFSLPPPIGPYEVGTVSFPLTDASRLDPLAPDTRLRTLMLSAFYPTSNTTSHPLSPAYTDLYASYLETTYALPSNSASTIISQAHTSAPFLSDPRNCSDNTTSPTPFPTLLFSPGYTISRVEYTALLTHLASLGHLVLALDHPFDANFLDYPDGTVALRRDPTTINWTSPDYVALRAADARFVISAFTQNQSVVDLIPGLHGTIDETRVAMVGHSFGGATTADTMLRDERVRCGVDLDGILFGPVVEAGLSRPFLIMGKEFRNRSVEPSWEVFAERATGWKREVSVRGALHIGFSDMGFVSRRWREMGFESEELSALEESVGVIDGERMLRLLGEYLRDFWEGCFGENGDWGLLEGESERWPEVVFWKED